MAKHNVAESTTKTVTILNGATGLSGAIDLEGYQLAAIIMPDTWVSAAITYLASDTLAGTYKPVYNNGIEVSGTVAQATVASVADNALALAPLRFIKLRSGTAGTPVNQTADRVLTLILKR